MTVEIAKGGNRNNERKSKAEGPSNKLFVLGYNPTAVKGEDIRCLYLLTRSYSW